MSNAFEHIKTQPFDMQAFHPHMAFIPNKKLFKTLFFFKNDLPAKIYTQIARIPGIGGPQM